MGQYRQNLERAVTAPPGTLRLLDLITPSRPDLMLAFYMAVRDTLVAPDLDAAVKIAYNGDKVVWRVVTKDGRIITSFYSSFLPLTGLVLY
jgi:chromosome segregation ATPase